MADRITVSFFYELNDSDALKMLAIDNDDYFDLSVQEPGEPVDIQSVARYLDQRKYVSSSPGNIRSITVTIRDNESGEEIVEKYSYWNQGKCERLVRTTNTTGELPWQETIQLALPNDMTVTAKFVKDGESVVAMEYLVNVGNELCESLPDDETPAWEKLVNLPKQKSATAKRSAAS